MSLFQSKTQLIGAAVGAGAAVVAAGHFLWTRRQPRILNLIIYPIKSLPGIQVNELEVTSIGVKHGVFLDRSYVILNESNNLVSQRVKPKLALIRTSLVGNCVVLDADGQEPLKIDVTEDLSNNERIEFELWKQPTAGVICSEKICNWLSDFLGAPVKVVRFIDELHPYRPSRVEKDGTVQDEESLPIRYQDGDPVLLINSTSVDEVNRRLTQSDQVTYMNFRPNIYVYLSSAFEEDNFKLLTIGDVTFQNIKPCDRCTFTTVNVNTGIKHPEILKVLTSFRMKEGYTSPCFGINLAPLQVGTVKLGDSIEVNSQK